MTISNESRSYHGRSDARTQRNGGFGQSPRPRSGIDGKNGSTSQGALHRAFSFFIFNSKGEWLLQQRAHENTTAVDCGRMHAAAIRGKVRLQPWLPHDDLQEELGLYCQAKPLFHFIYRSEFSNALIEHELDHVCVGYSDQLPEPTQKKSLAIDTSARKHLNLN